MWYMPGSRIGGGGGGVGPDHLENNEAIEFLSVTDPDPFENQKATKPVFNVRSSSALQRNAI